MRIPPRFAALGAALALVPALLAGAPVATAATAVTNTPAAARAVAAFDRICHSALPSQAHTTLRLIEAGGPYPYRQDGSVFQNREGLLPRQSTGYYHEYTVKTPGSTTRGARRIVTGETHQEDYYTKDHYRSFSLVDYRC
ncbi:ribonuclease domain-containing protein [Streptomyces sp. NPDC058953]|uniref:ribonuclease domain-containing protein n=1 Tax=unclassified Streptomyces TaxID=2593676 RepID=UPI00367CD8E8